MATNDLRPEFVPESGIRARVRRLVENPVFQKAIMALIVVNAFTLGMETSPTVMAVIGPQILVFDKIVIVIFCVEIVLRLYAHGPRFFRDPWSVFDFIVVAITLTPSNDSLSVLRSLRVLRVLRLVSAVPRLRRIVAALLHAVPGVGAIGALLMLVFYVFAVITTKLFGAAARVFSKPVGYILGTIGGFTSFIIHAGLPPIAMYLLPQRLDKRIHVGTIVILFCIVNYAKILPYWWLGLFTMPNLSVSLILMPLAPVGMVLGIKFNHLIPQKVFLRISYTILFILGARLLYEGLAPMF